MKPKIIYDTYCDQCCDNVGVVYQCPSCGMHLCTNCYNSLHPCTAELPEQDDYYVERKPHELGR